MRLGVTLTPGDEAATALAAESLGVPFVHVTGAAATETAVAATVVVATASVRIVVGIAIGDENPVTLAEEIAVLDNLSNGRIAVLAELGDLAADDAVEDVTVLRAAWSGRAIAHQGKRWRVPARLDGHRAPSSVMVTPAPAQLQIPLWVAGTSAATVSASLSLPAVATTPGDVDRAAPVAPGRSPLVGDLDTDRQAVVDWAAAGATHLLCELGEAATLDTLVRWLLPEVAMVAFPRVVADAPLPASWPQRSAPGSGR